MRMVESLSEPYPEPITQPFSFRLPTIVLALLPAGSLRQETVQLWRPSRGRNSTPCARDHDSVVLRIASCRAQRAVMPPARSIRSSCVCNAYNRETAGVLVGWNLALAVSKLMRSKYSPRAGSVLARSTMRSDATPRARPGGNARAFWDPVKTKSRSQASDSTGDPAIELT